MAHWAVIHSLACISARVRKGSIDEEVDRQIVISIRAYEYTRETGMSCNTSIGRYVEIEIRRLVA
eukprot:7334299-Pyramimonas_sp.AAC.1